MFVRGVWAMEPKTAETYYPLVTRILKGESDIQASSDEDEVYPVAFDRSAQDLGRNATDEAASVVAVIPIKGAIVKYDQWCGPIGMETISRYIRRAADDDSVAAIIMDFDTGGGQGDACMAPTAEIRRAMEKKPVVAYTGNGMCASAGYWIASNCNEIYATFETDMVGSIGTFVTLADWAAFYENQGLPIHEVYATKSKKKNKMFKDALEGKYKELRENFIDPFNESFISTVKAGRGDKVEDAVFEGTLYYAEDAVSFGLIDGLKSFEDVIQRAFDLADARNTNDNSKSAMKGLFAKDPKFDALIALAKTKSEERTEEMVNDVNTELQAAGLDASLVDNEALKANEKTLSDGKAAGESLAAIDAALGEDHKSEEGTTADAVQALIDATSDQAQKITDLEAQVKELGGKAAEETTITTTENPDEIKETTSEGQEALDREAKYANEKLNELL